MAVIVQQFNSDSREGNWQPNTSSGGNDDSSSKPRLHGVKEHSVKGRGSYVSQFITVIDYTMVTYIYI